MRGGERGNGVPGLSFCFLSRENERERMKEKENTLDEFGVDPFAKILCRSARDFMWTPLIKLYPTGEQEGDRKSTQNERIQISLLKCVFRANTLLLEYIDRN